MHQIIVCVKAVPDPRQAGNIKIDPATKTLTRCNVPLVANPLDRHAVTAALELKEADGAHVSVISMGPPEAGNVVKECLALGADQGILLSDRAFGGADAYATARTLSRGIEKIGKADIIFCGMASADGSTEWVGPEIAVFLNLPVVTQVFAIEERKETAFTVKASVGNGYRRVQVQLPALFAVTRELNTPRRLSFSGIIKARRKTIDQWGLEDLGLEEHMVGQKGSPTAVAGLQTRDNRRRGEILSGTREEKADRLLEKLVAAGAV